MMKKIGAVLLALVLCLSVAVLPVYAGFNSDYTLASGKSVAYKIELDKPSYKAGETVTVKLFMRIQDADQLNGAALTFAVNSALFDLTENAADTVKTTATLSDNAATLFKAPKDYQWAWLSGTPLTRLTQANTAEENALYDSYLKTSLARDMYGTHENAGVTTKGLPGSEINADDQPLFQFQLKLKDNIADGTAVNVAITSGTINGKPAQATASIFVNGATRATNMAATGFDVSAAVASATVGQVAPAGPVLTKAVSQVKMTLTSATTVAEPFQYRVISKISGDDWNTYFANTGKEGATTKAITSVGFVAYRGAAPFDMQMAKDVATGVVNGNADYATKETDYIQYNGSEARFGCRIDFTSKPENDVTYIAFAKYLDADGQPQIVFYNEAYSSPVASDYTGMVNAYIGAFGDTFVG